MRFATNDFIWLNDDEEYMPGWNAISLSELTAKIEAISPEAFTVIDAFSAMLNAVGCLDESLPTLSFKIDDGGMVEVVSSPAIYAKQDEDTKSVTGFAFRCGDYITDVVVNGTTATINGFEGEVTVEERGEDPNKYCVVNFERFLEVIDDGIEIQFRLDTERDEVKGLKKAKLKNLVGKGDLLSLMQIMPSGESWIKPRDLEVGEYSVVSMEELDPHPEYGRSWAIQVEGIGKVVLQSKRIKRLLETNAKTYMNLLANGQPLTYNLSGKKELPQGVSITDGFFKRAPKPERLAAGAKPIAAMASATPSALPQSVQTVTTTAEPVQKELEHAF